MTFEDQPSEVESLNLDHLHVEELEQRLEMAAAPLSHEIEEEPKCCSQFSGGCWGYC